MVRKVSLSEDINDWFELVIKNTRNKKIKMYYK